MPGVTMGETMFGLASGNPNPFEGKLGAGSGAN
jgi:hypothetical protein